MHNTYRVAIADDNPIDLGCLRKILIQAGHQIVLEDRTGAEFFRNCLAAAPDVILTDVQPSGMESVEEEQASLASQKIPVIIISDIDIHCFLDNVSAYRAMAFLTKPVRESELRAAMAIAVHCFKELQSSRAEACTLRQALEDRKLIERAKGIVMRKRSVDEPAAFKCLQTLARSHRKTLVDVARCIIFADQALAVSGIDRS
jgi:response regulator NasT